MENGLSGEKVTVEEMEELALHEDKVSELFRLNPSALEEFVNNPCYTLLVTDLKSVREQYAIELMHAIEPHSFHRLQGKLMEIDETLTSLNYFMIKLQK